MSNRHGIVDTIIDSLAPVNRDGHKFIAIAAGLALIFFLVGRRSPGCSSSPRSTSRISSAIRTASHRFAKG